MSSGQKCPNNHSCRIRYSFHMEFIVKFRFVLAYFCMRQRDSCDDCRIATNLFCWTNKIVLGMYYFVLAILCTSLGAGVQGGMVKMKILDEFGTENRYDGAYNDHWGAGDSSNTKQLKLRIKPAPVSGPKYMQKLAGKCFSTTIANYRYELCPYDNITQYEDSSRWNPYRGVLGVWQSWSTRSPDHTHFTGMLYGDGDQCGPRARSVNVSLSCGARHVIVNMTEVETCRYRMEFTTPYVCHPRATLVYPTLDGRARRLWDTLYTLRNNSHITQQAYETGVGGVLESAGLALTERRRSELMAEQEAESRRREEAAVGRGQRFTSLEQCAAAYDAVKAERDDLREQRQAGPAGGKNQSEASPRPLGVSSNQSAVVDTDYVGGDGDTS